jgi:hypothetical protein
MKEELQSLDEPTRRFTAVCSRPRLSHRRQLSLIPANAMAFLKSNYGDELVRSPRMTGTIAEESMCQEK